MEKRGISQKNALSQYQILTDLVTEIIFMQLKFSLCKPKTFMQVKEKTRRMKFLGTKRVLKFLWPNQ